MRFLLWGFFWLAGATWGFQLPPPKRPTNPVVARTVAPHGDARSEEQSHASQVLGGMRTYRVFLPPTYSASQKRYPVIYWLYGYEQAIPEREKEIGDYVSAHDVIVVYVGPVETTGEYPMYFPELVDHVDHTLRTAADRDHRAVTGYSVGGFLSFYTAGKYPDLVGSASSFLGITESPVGPRGFEVDYRLHEIDGNYAGVRTRLVADPREPVHYYHQRLNDIWLLARTGHESADFDRERANTAIPDTFDFHMHCFATPQPKPAAFNHTDPYPNFDVWGWQVSSNRRQPGFTVLDHVSAKGFRSAVREWAPGGALIPAVKLNLESARLYAPASVHTVTYVRLRDRNVRHTQLKADAQGRLNFDLTGDAYEVAVGEEAQIAVAGWEVDGASWATAGAPVKLRVRFENVGAVRSATGMVKWESPNSGVKFEPASSRLFGMAPGETAPVPVTVTVADAARPLVHLVAVVGASRVAFDVPLFPPAGPARIDSDFQIADGVSVNAWQHATDQAETVFGEGNHDGEAAPGESFVVLLRDGAAWRPAELFSTDSCLDNGLRGSDSWDYSDHQMASMPYTVASIPAMCEPGRPVHALARIVTPSPGGYQTRYAAIEFPVWYRHGEEPHGTAGKAPAR